MNKNAILALKVLGCVGALVLLALIIFFVWAELTGFPGAIDTGRSRYTHDRIVELSDAFEMYASSRGRYPVGDCLDALAEASGQDSLLRFTDGWRRPLMIDCNGNSYTIISYAGDGKPDAPDLSSYTLGRTMDFESDFVFSDGRYLQWPEMINVPDTITQE